MRISAVSKTSINGDFMNLVGKTINDAVEMSEVCSQYLAMQSGASIKNPHPYAVGQCNYEAGGPSARISDVATALVSARYGSRLPDYLKNGGPSQMISAALTMGDLQTVISNAVQLIVMPSYESLSEDILKWTKAIEVENFKEGVFSSVDVDELIEIQEGAEVKHGVIHANGETFKLKTFGRNILIHRNLLINNDFAVIVNAIQAYVVSSARKDAMLQYGILNDNAAMEDGTTLFHADHNNLRMAAVISQASIGGAMSMLREQPTVSGEKSNAKAAVMLVPSKYEALASSEVNKLLNSKIEVISSAYLNDDAWYLLADPKQYPVVGRILLEESKAPLLIEPASSRSLPLKHDGMGVTVRLDVNASALSHVGAVKTPF